MGMAVHFTSLLMAARVQSSSGRRVRGAVSASATERWKRKKYMREDGEEGSEEEEDAAAGLAAAAAAGAAARASGAARAEEEILPPQVQSDLFLSLLRCCLCCWRWRRSMRRRLPPAPELAHSAARLAALLAAVAATMALSTPTFHHRRALTVPHSPLLSSCCSSEVPFEYSYPKDIFSYFTQLPLRQCTRSESASTLFKMPSPSNPLGQSAPSEAAAAAAAHSMTSHLASSGFRVTQRDAAFPPRARGEKVSSFFLFRGKELPAFAVPEQKASADLLLRWECRGD